MTSRCGSILDNLIVAGCTDMEHWDSLSNRRGDILAQCRGLRSSRTLPGSTGLWAVSGHVQDRYHFDGFYSESPAYAAHNFSNVSELPDILRGYTDPPGYEPTDGHRLDDYDPFALGRFNLALLSMVRQLAPGNRLPVIGDTVYNTTISPVYAETLADRLGGPYAGLLSSIRGVDLADWGSEYSLWYRDPDLKAEGQTSLPLRTEWFPGWHVGVLRGDAEANETALFLNGNEHRWTIQSGHRQHDILSISLYALVRELASDATTSLAAARRPLTQSGQVWTSSSHSHNLVVVDEANQARISVAQSGAVRRRAGR